MTSSSVLISAVLRVFQPAVAEVLCEEAEQGDGHGGAVRQVEMDEAAAGLRNGGHAAVADARAAAQREFAQARESGRQQPEAGVCDLALTDVQGSILLIQIYLTLIMDNNIFITRYSDSSFPP